MKSEERVQMLGQIVLRYSEARRELAMQGYQRMLWGDALRAAGHLINEVLDGHMPPGEAPDHIPEDYPDGKDIGALLKREKELHEEVDSCIKVLGQYHLGPSDVPVESDLP